MAVKIRLARAGKKKKPSYRVVVADQRFQRDGRIIETLAQYDPTRKPRLLRLKQDRVQYWMGHGATPTHTVSRLIKDASKQVEAPQAETPQTDTTPSEPEDGDYDDLPF